MIWYIWWGNVGPMGHAGILVTIIYHLYSDNQNQHAYLLHTSRGWQGDQPFYNDIHCSLEQVRSEFCFSFHCSLFHQFHKISIKKCLCELWPVFMIYIQPWKCYCFNLSAPSSFTLQYTDRDRQRLAYCLLFSLKTLSLIRSFFVSSPQSSVPTPLITQTEFYFQLTSPPSQSSPVSTPIYIETE